MTPGIRQVFRLPANKVATSSTVLATLGMAVPCGVNQKQHLKWWIPFTEAAGTAGIKFELIAPAALTNFMLSFIIYNLVSGHVAIDNAGLQVAAAAFTGTGANAGNYLAVIEADIVTGANSGVIDLQFSQGVSDAGATTVLLEAG